MNDIRAIFLDFDGTVFSHVTDSIPLSTIESVRTLRNNGIRVFLCTGRAVAEMPAFDLSDLPLDAWILSNGQVILDENGKIVHDRKIEGILKDRILSLFNEKSIPMYMITIDDIYLNMVNQKVLDVQNAVSSGIPRIKEYEGEDIYMASAFFSSEAEKERLTEIMYEHEKYISEMQQQLEENTSSNQELLNMQEEQLRQKEVFQNEIALLSEQSQSYFNDRILRTRHRHGQFHAGAQGTCRLCHGRYR